MARQGSIFGSNSNWPSPAPVPMHPQPLPVAPPPTPSRVAYMEPPVAASMGSSSADTAKASPSTTAKAPPRHAEDLWDNSGRDGRSETPITITKTLADSVRDTEKRIVDNTNDKFVQIMNCVRDLERQVVLLKEEIQELKESHAQGHQENPWTQSWNAQAEGARDDNTQYSAWQDTSGDATGWSWREDDRAAWSTHEWRS
jgi:hypothetical protein